MNKTLLAIGDNKDWDSFLKFRRQRHLLKRHGIAFALTDYESVLNDELPEITTGTVIIFLFFPFVYWDKHIEPEEYRGVYGNREFYTKLKKFWRTIDHKLRRHYRDKKICFINDPKNIPIERDKRATKRILSRNGTRVPRTYGIKNVSSMLKRLRAGEKFFIKPRFGSMGKGITYLEEDDWSTNFGFRKNRIVNRHSDYGWKFRNVTGNKAFLRQLLGKDMVIEEAVPCWLIHGRHFDIRCLVFFGKVIYMYPRSNTADKVTTNVSQGARNEKMRFLNDVPGPLAKKVKPAAVKAAKILSLDFAGVDLMLDPVKKEVVIIELNAFPGFPKVRTFNLARHVINEIGKKKWK